MHRIHGQSLEALEVAALERLAPRFSSDLAMLRRCGGDPDLSIDDFESGIDARGDLTIRALLSNGSVIAATAAIDLHILQCMGNA